MNSFASVFIIMWVFLMCLICTCSILNCVFSLNRKEREETMKLYKVTLHSSIDTEFAVIAQSGRDAIDILIEYFNYIHQHHTNSEFSVNTLDLESVHHPMIFIKKVG